MQHDYTGEEEGAAPDQVALLGRLVDELAAAEALVEQRQQELAEAQEQARKLREHDIPELMNGMGAKGLQTASGLSVKLREEVRASLPKDPARRAEAFEWLRQNNHEGLIKHEISVKFVRGQGELSDQIYDLISKHAHDQGVPIALVRKDDIHHQTLCAFLREQLKQGTGVPLTKFGAFIQKFAEVKRDV